MWCVGKVKWRCGTSSHAERSDYKLLSSEGWEAFPSPELASDGTATPFSRIHQCSRQSACSLLHVQIAQGSLAITHISSAFSIRERLQAESYCKFAPFLACSLFVCPPALLVACGVVGFGLVGLAAVCLVVPSCPLG